MPSYLILYFMEFDGGKSFHEKALLNTVQRKTAQVPVALCIPPGKKYIIVVFNECSCGSTHKLMNCERYVSRSYSLHIYIK